MIKKKRSFISSVLKLPLALLLSQIGLTKKVIAKSKPKVVVLGAGFEGRLVLAIFQTSPI